MRNYPDARMAFPLRHPALHGWEISPALTQRTNSLFYNASSDFFESKRSD